MAIETVTTVQNELPPKPTPLPLRVSMINYQRMRMLAACDSRCDYAHGIAGRERVRLSKNENDWAYVSDDDAGPAAENYAARDFEKPRDGKPHTKHCVQICERSCLFSQDALGADWDPVFEADLKNDDAIVVVPQVPEMLPIKDFRDKVFNMQNKHEGEE